MYSSAKNDHRNRKCKQLPCVIAATYLDLNDKHSSSESHR